MKPIDPTWQAKYAALLKEAGIVQDADLAAEMIHAAIRLAADKPGRGEMKLMARSFKELRYAFKVFKPYRGRRKVSMFGSARTAPEDPNYIMARQFGKLLADAGFMVITGAGGGIMAAGHEGAGQAHSFGVAIKLPFEQATNPIIANDEKLIHFRYFFSRKLVFVKETHAIVLFPGGFGTHDEGFEVLTLVQTGRCDPLPIVLIERPGGGYWKAWDKFVREQLLGDGLISPEDTALYYITDDARAGVDHVVRFYRNYHSLRYAHEDLIMRLRHAPTPDELAQIQREFADIIPSGEGTFKVRNAPQLAEDAEMVPQMPRLVFQFDRRSMARLRMLIDHLNVLPSLPPMQPESPAAADIGTKHPDRGVAEIAEEEPIALVGPIVRQRAKRDGKTSREK